MWSADEHPVVDRVVVGVELARAVSDRPDERDDHAGAGRQHQNAPRDPAEDALHAAPRTRAVVQPMLPWDVRRTANQQCGADHHYHQQRNARTATPVCAKCSPVRPAQSPFNGLSVARGISDHEAAGGTFTAFTTLPIVADDGLVCVGDSIVLADRSWASRLAQAGGWPLGRLAERGARSWQVVNQLPELRAHRYAVGALTVGANDVLFDWDEQRLEANVSEILEAMNAACDRVLVQTLPRSFRRFPRSSPLRREISDSEPDRPRCRGEVERRHRRRRRSVRPAAAP